MARNHPGLATGLVFPSEEKLDPKLQHLATKAEIANLATKTELELWGGALLARMNEQSAELTRHVKAIQESFTAQFKALDEKYDSLPGRVARLERKVFAPKRRRGSA